MNAQKVIALAVFLRVYTFIITERIHRTVAAMVGASTVLLVGIVPWKKVPEYLDLGTILLLAGMMVVVNVARESGNKDRQALKG